MDVVHQHNKRSRGQTLLGLRKEGLVSMEVSQLCECVAAVMSVFTIDEPQKIIRNDELYRKSLKEVCMVNDIKTSCDIKQGECIENCQLSRYRYECWGGCFVRMKSFVV